MLTLHGASQGADPVQLLIVLFAIAVVAFWRAVLKIVIIIATTVILILITSGAVTLLHSAHLMIR